MVIERGLGEEGLIEMFSRILRSSLKNLREVSI